MTTYGTIPTTTTATATTPQQPSENLEFISRATHKIQSTITTHRRPWSLFFSLSISLPSFNNALLRIKTNLSFFRVNYAIVSLLSLFLSLLWHPFSLIVFLLTMAAWLFLYFLRDQPLIVHARAIDEWIVLALLSVFTVGFLLFTNVTTNIVVAIAVAVLVIVVHAAVRDTEDLPVVGFDDGGARRGYDFSTRAIDGMGERLPLKDTASSSFSASN